MSRKLYSILGASNHAPEQREKNDFYATPPIAANLLLEVEPTINNVWECACGQGHLAKVFEEKGLLTRATDFVYRGFGELDSLDFLNYDQPYDGDIVTNPPYKHAQAFISKALSIVTKGRIVAMFLKLTFLEGKSRKNFFVENPPKIIYVSSSRIKCAKNGNFDEYKSKSSSIAYAWFVWEKGYSGVTQLVWIN